MSMGLAGLHVRPLTFIQQLIMDLQSLRQIVCAAGHTVGIEKLTEDQINVIYSFVCGKDVFVCLPTGSGKSLCFALLPLVFDKIRGLHEPQSIAFIVSPLTALIKNQVSMFQSKGLKAGYIGASQADQHMITDILQGTYQLVYTSPEALVNNTTYRSMLLKEVWQDNLVAFVVDEAHCIKTW